MGVYIKGMEMPKVEFGSVIVAIRPDGMVEDVMGCYVGKAVPVPPHGRLIDADALHNAIAANIIGSRCGEETSVEIAINEAIIDDLMIIDAQQTIIPASEEGEK